MKVASLAVLATWAASALANPLPDSLVKYLDRRVSVTDQDLLTWKFYVEYAAASFCNTNATVGARLFCGSSCPAVEATGATVLATMKGTVTDMQGYVAKDPVNKQIVVALRGSVSIRNWITDLVFIQSDAQDLVKGGKIHAGFLAAFNEIKHDWIAAVDSAQAANPGYKLVYVGHSLGAAVATVGAAYHRAAGYAMDLYVYGSPRVGNLAFADLVTNQPGLNTRVTHVDDPVPRLPPLFTDYRHLSPEYWLSTGNATTVDYAAADVKVCEGYSNLECNGQTSGLDGDAHIHYLERLDTCQPAGQPFKRRLRRRVESDGELEAKVNGYVEQDAAFADGLSDVWA